jgi:lycopene cyclase domain-containing protein
VEKYLYLSVDLACLLLPLLFSFYPKANFSSKWKFLWPAIGIPAVLFIMWDAWFTQMGIWGFNPRYLTGVYTGNLPLEEILFFICIPYACVFTYEAVNHFQKSEPLPDNGRRVTWILVAGLLLVGLKNYDRLYTSVTCIAMAVMLVFLQVVVKPQYLARFYFAYIFMLIPFLLVNGFLTGTGLDEPVVWYNNRENLGIRIMSIPFEDTFYGMLLILMNVSIFEYLQRKHISKSPSTI